jgi:hypothetical protein
MFKPGVAGLVVGLMALAVPQVLGTGYGWVQVAMGAALLALPLWVVIALPFAKIAATSLFDRLRRLRRDLRTRHRRRRIPRRGGVAPRARSAGRPPLAGAFVVVGMIACFGSIAHAPLAVMLMVAEMTGTLEMLAPAMVAVGLASAVVGDATIYENQLRNRTEAPAHRFRFGLPLLASLPVSEAMRPPRLVLHEDVAAREAHEQLAELGLPGTPVGDGDGTFQGSVDIDRLAAADPDQAVRSLTDGTVSAVPKDATWTRSSRSSRPITRRGCRCLMPNVGSSASSAPRI